MSISRRLAVLVALLAAACGSHEPCDSQSGACLSIEVSSAVSSIASLRIDLADSDKGWKYDFVTPLPRSGLPAAEAVLLPADLASTGLNVLVSGNDATNTALARGESVLIVSGGHDVTHVRLVAFGGTGCTDGVTDGTETDVDCGGSCPSCAPGALCLEDTDCASTMCLSNVCAKPLCANGIKDATESDVDCGGSCPSCADGKSCTAATDCKSGGCAAGVCQLSGGSTCTTDAQCAGGQCALGVCADAPVLTSAVPAIVPSNRTTQVHLHGTGFTAGSHLAVTIDGASVPVTFVSATDVLVTTPVALGRHGAVTVALTSGGGATASSKTILSYDLGMRTFAGGNTQFMQTGSGTVGGAFVADLDQDGQLDLVVDVIPPPDDSDPTYIRPGAGGLFVDDPKIPTLPGGVTGVGDFDEDGTLDLLLYDTVYLGHGAFHFTAGQVTGAPGNCQSFVADVDGDKHLDAIYNCYNAMNPVYRGRGDGTFMAAQPLPGTDSSWVVGDLDHDGKADVVSMPYDGSPNALTVRLAAGGGSFAAGVSYSLPSSTTNPDVAPVLADYDGDGRLDVVVNLTTGAVLFHNDGTGALTMGAGSVTSAGMNVIASGDFDADGHVDLVASELTPQLRASILLGHGDGTFAAPVDIWSFGDASVVDSTASVPGVVGDFDGDGRLDVGFAVPSGWTTVYAPLAAGAVPTLMGPGGTDDYGNISATGVADLDHDGLDDFLLIGNVPQSLSVYLARPNRTFVALTPAPLTARVSTTALGDFNGDGHVDLAIAGEGGGGLYLGVGDGTFTAPTSSLGIAYPNELTAADVNGDGKLDLVESYGGTSGTLAHLGDGKGGFAAGTTLTNAGDCTFARVDADAKPDIVCSRSGELEWQSGNGDGTFGPDNDFGPAYTTAIFMKTFTVADFTGDGFADVVSGPVLYTNDGHGHFTASSQAITWLAGTPRDIDLDGILDLDYTSDGGTFAIGSPGVRQTGVEYSSFGEPHRFGDFDGDGLVDFVVIHPAYHGGGEVFAAWNRSY